jgi:hypothetical protein
MEHVSLREFLRDLPVLSAVNHLHKVDDAISIKTRSGVSVLSLACEPIYQQLLPPAIFFLSLMAEAPSVRGMALTVTKQPGLVQF